METKRSSIEVLEEISKLIGNKSSMFKYTMLNVTHEIFKEVFSHFHKDKEPGLYKYSVAINNCYFILDCFTNRNDEIVKTLLEGKDNKEVIDYFLQSLNPRIKHKMI